MTSTSLPPRAVQCTFHDARGERCCGLATHAGSHLAEDGCWDLPAPAPPTPNAAAVLAVLNRNRRTGGPSLPMCRPLSEFESPPATTTIPETTATIPPSNLLNETQRIRQTVSKVLQSPTIYPTAVDAVAALLDDRNKLLERIVKLEDFEARHRPRDETFTASFLRKCLNLPDDMELRVEGDSYSETEDEPYITLNDHEQVLRAVPSRRRTW